MEEEKFDFKLSVHEVRESSNQETKKYRIFIKTESFDGEKPIFRDMPFTGISVNGVWYEKSKDQDSVENQYQESKL